MGSSATSTAVASLLRTPGVYRPRLPRQLQAPRFGLQELCGRLVQLSAHGGSALLTVATELVLEAQRTGEPVAWISAGDLPYPPDVARRGVDLAALALIRPPDVLAGLLRSAERLLRSGAFGLLLLELGGRPCLPLAAQTRLASLAQRHDTALVCLTSPGGQQTSQQDSLGSLVSLHARVSRQREETEGSSRFGCCVEVLKDKRRGPGWVHHAEGYHGPAGLR